MQNLYLRQQLKIINEKIDELMKEKSAKSEQVLTKEELDIQKNELYEQIQIKLDLKQQEMKKLVYKHWKMQETLTDVAAY